MPKSSILLPCGAGLLALLVPHAPAHAEGDPAPSRSAPDHFVIDDANPESNLPTPQEATERLLEFGTLMTELSSRADGARHREDWLSALKYDRALAVLTPDVAAAFGFVCLDHEMLGQRQEALQACGAAFNKKNAPLDVYKRFVGLVANRPGGTDAVEVEDARAAIDHLKTSEATRVSAYQLQCELSLRSKDGAALQECASELMKLAPDDARSITFAWSSALKQGDYDAARALVETAKQKHLPAEAVARMERGIETISSSADAPKQSAWRSTNPMVRWLVGLVVLLVPAVVLARRKLTALKST